MKVSRICILAALMMLEPAGRADEPKWVVKDGLFKSLTEPPCSYCVNQNRKGLLKDGERVIAWVRGQHNGGAFPLRQFIAAPRVINDTYGLFFYDPDGGYVSAFKKDYGYEFHGWRNGVMTVRDRDGTVWSALSGLAIDGPKKGARLERIPAMPTTWGYWLMLHPESTAYDLFDGKKYPEAELPIALSDEAKQSMGNVDGRLRAEAPVVGVESGDARKAFPLDFSVERACFNDDVGGEPVTVFSYGLTRSAIAWNRKLDGQILTFYADEISPETAPFKDKETGTRWSLAGRGIDGPLRNRELTWAPSLVCKWYAWVAENPNTAVHMRLRLGSDFAGMWISPIPMALCALMLGSAVTWFSGWVCTSPPDPPTTASPARPFRVPLISPAQTTDSRLAELKAKATESLILDLSDATADLEATKAAAGRIRAAGLQLYYWIEVGRCPPLADAHPEWMASLQGHQEWRRFYPDFPKPADGEVVKNYPWVPVVYRESFDAHLERIGKLLGGLPAPRGIFLNDLQGAPSACGCGHPLCRWTADYGPVKTATPLGSDAAAKFCAAVKKLSPGADVIPVWTSECEEADYDTLCAKVGCYQGTCWKEWTKQMKPLADECPRIAALLPYKLFERNLPRYGGEAAWIGHAVKSFGQTPQDAHPISAGRLIAVVQGWDVTPEQIDAQVGQAGAAGCAGTIVAMSRIEQAWKPVMHRWK